MEIKICIPDISGYADGAKAFTIEEWLVSEGDEVNTGQVVMVLGSGNKEFAIEHGHEKGRIEALLFEAGPAEHAVGTEVARMTLTEGQGAA